MPSEVDEWRFLLDENTDPKTAADLQKEGLHAEHVRDALWLGADDEDDILPYAREHDLVVVTSDVRDFGSLAEDAHAGLVILYDDTMPPSAWRRPSWRWSTPIPVARRSRDVKNSIRVCDAGEPGSNPSGSRSHPSRDEPI